MGGNCLSKNVCVALATFLRKSTTEFLNICSSEISDDGIEVLVHSLNSHQLQQLYLVDNPLITTRGWKLIASLLKSANSNIERIYIKRNTIDNDAVAALTSALVNNRSLTTLDIDNESLTAEGSNYVHKLLCNTSSVNATFLSNHTLGWLGSTADIPNETIAPLLRLNRRDDEEEIATIKMLQCHDDFDMQSFFEWELKVLPLVIGWFEKASAYEMPEDFEPNIESRKLSTIYQFARGMPVLYVETCLRKELEDVKEEQLVLEELRMLTQPNRIALEERKKNIVDRLGRL